MRHKQGFQCRKDIQKVYGLISVAQMPQDASETHSDAETGVWDFTGCRQVPKCLGHRQGRGHGNRDIMFVLLGAQRASDKKFRPESGNAGKGLP